MNSDQSDPKPAISTESNSDPLWERELLSKLAFSALEEQRRARRWSIGFKFAFFGYLILLLVLYLPTDTIDFGATEKHTALVDIKGVIAADSEANADNIIAGLRAAFADSATAGVILRINSPGGSPVQAGYVSDEITRLRGKYPKIPLYAVIVDVTASGGYYIAAAADKIYANKASIVGSIGVVMNSFGFVETMKKVGVERRLFTAGASKGLLDPFSPLREKEVRHIQGMLDTIHRQFIATVRKGRGTRLKEDPELYSGLIWTGEQSLALGLVDAMGSSSYVAREVIGAKKIVNYTPQRNLLESIANRIGAQMGKTIGAELGMTGPQLR